MWLNLLRPKNLGLTFQSTHPVRDVTWIFSWLNFSSGYFNPHIPWGMWLPSAEIMGRMVDISIHTSREGCDITLYALEGHQYEFQSTHPVRDVTGVRVQVRVGWYNFNPHIPWGIRQVTVASRWMDLIFQSTYPVRDTTSFAFSLGASYWISIHVSREGYDKDKIIRLHKSNNFNPRIPWGIRLPGGADCRSNHSFQSTYPVRDTTLTIGYEKHWEVYFNPRIPWGIRPLELNINFFSRYFNPRIPWGIRPT